MLRSTHGEGRAQGRVRASGVATGQCGGQSLGRRELTRAPDARARQAPVPVPGAGRRAVRAC